MEYMIWKSDTKFIVWMSLVAESHLDLSSAFS